VVAVSFSGIGDKARTFTDGRLLTEKNVMMR